MLTKALTALRAGHRRWISKDRGTISG